MMKHLFAQFVLLLICSAGISQTRTQTIYLSGHGCDDAVKWEFFCTGGANSGKWTRIDVPSCWELQGFGSYQYGNELPRHAFNCEGIADEQGLYRHSFTVPSSWRGSHVELVFEGSMTDTDVKVNGISAGPVHRGAFYRFSYDVSGLLRYGRRNLLEAAVSKESADSTVNVAQRRADYWNFGGIFRPVYLVRKPASYIDRVAIDARADGSFTAECHVVNAPEGAVSRVAVKGGDGSTLARGEAAAGEALIRCRADNPRLWTAETPNLYVAEFSLCDRDGRVLHVERQKFGFRTMETRASDGIYVNGSKIEVRGVDRHCFRPETGRTLSRALNLEDVKLIKSLNMNAVRCSHYPPDPEFLDMCDSLGLYVIDEFNSWQQPMSTAAGWNLVREMVTRDVNHPCILWWANGNEGGFNYELEPQYYTYDPQKRPVIYPWSNRNGYETKHYCSFGQMQEYMRKPEVFMPTEFLHGLYDGGHGAGLEDYWNEIRTNPRAAGFFLWSLADEGVIRHDKADSLDCMGHWAPDGIVGPHSEKEGSYSTVRQIWCPVQVSFDGKALSVSNRYDFTDLSQCRFRLSFVSFDGMKETVLSSVEVQGPQAAPDESGTIAVPEAPLGAQALKVMAADSFGEELFTWSFDLGTYSKEFRGTGAGFSEEGGFILARAGEYTWAFDKSSGLLSCVRSAGRSLSLSNGPRFIALRRSDRSIDNELNTLEKNSERHTHYELLPDNALFAGFAVEGDCLVGRYSGGAMKELRWTFASDGSARVDYRYCFSGVVDLMGVEFDYPEDMVRSKKWVGDGPYRVWQNRLKGPQLGVWEVPYNDAVPGFNIAYPEFKGFFSGVKNISFDTEEGPLSFTVPSGKYFGVFTPKDGPTHNLFVFPEMGLSFLDVIPAVRTKFHSTDTLGPSSRPVWASGEYEGSVVISLHD